MSSIDIGLHCVGARAVSGWSWPNTGPVVALLIAMSGGTTMFYAVYNMNNTPEVIRANNAREPSPAATSYWRWLPLRRLRWQQMPRPGRSK